MSRRTALLVVDMQRDFCDDGPVPVPGALSLLPAINQLMRDATQRRAFDLVLATKDWHPPNHVSFVPQHEQAGMQLGDIAATPSKKHFFRLFNPHCVAGTPGADFAGGLEVGHIQRTFHKGTDANREAYSGFHDMGHKHSTGLAEFLREQGVGAVYVVGVALDYCVKATVLDSLGEGFETHVIVDAVKAVDAEEGERVLGELQQKGAKLVRLEGGTGVKGQPPSQPAEVRRAEV